MLNISVLDFYCLIFDFCLSSEKWLRDLFFNENCNISPVIFHSQALFEHKLGEKRPVKQKKFIFYETNVFFFKFQTLYISKINSFLD